MDFFSYIRKLAKTHEMINLFVASKDLNGIKFFKNETNLSKLQTVFLSYVYMYYDLYQDIGLNKVSKKVLENEIYEDAYIYYKNKKEQEKDEKKTKKGKIRKFSGVFSKDNKINFKKIEENK